MWCGWWRETTAINYMYTMFTMYSTFTHNVRYVRTCTHNIHYVQYMCTQCSLHTCTNNAHYVHMYRKCTHNAHYVCTYVQYMHTMFTTYMYIQCSLCTGYTIFTMYSKYTHNVHYVQYMYTHCSLCTVRVHTIRTHRDFGGLLLLQEQNMIAIAKNMIAITTTRAMTTAIIN